MSTKTKFILIMALLAWIDFVVPVPVVATVCIYVAATRPAWFPELVEKVYRTD